MAAGGAAAAAAAAVAAASNFVEVPSAVFYKTYTAATLEDLTVEAHDLINETLEAVPVTTNRMEMGGVSFELEPVAASHRLVLRATGNPAWVLIFARIAKGAGWRQEKRVSLFRHVAVRDTPNIRQAGFNGPHWLDPAENRSAAHGPRSEKPAAVAMPAMGRLSASLRAAEAAALAADPGAAIPAGAHSRFQTRRFRRRRESPTNAQNAAANAVFRRFLSDGSTYAEATAAARAAALVVGATNAKAVTAAERARVRHLKEVAEDNRGGPPQRLGGGARRTVKRRKQ
jgi:hypothetical protein